MDISERAHIVLGSIKMDQIRNIETHIMATGYQICIADEWIISIGWYWVTYAVERVNLGEVFE